MRQQRLTTTPEISKPMSNVRLKNINAENLCQRHFGNKITVIVGIKKISGLLNTAKLSIVCNVY